MAQAATTSRDDDLHGAVRERLAAADQRYSPGRQRLVTVLAEAERPLTIPELLEDHADIPQSSAYRNLAVLEGVGVVSRIATGGEHARFELAEDLVGHHHHLICTSCGRVEDFTVADRVERTIDHALAAAIAPTGFTPLGHRLDLIGLCADCGPAD